MTTKHIVDTTVDEIKSCVQEAIWELEDELEWLRMTHSKRRRHKKRLKRLLCLAEQDLVSKAWDLLKGETLMAWCKRVGILKCELYTRMFIGYGLGIDEVRKISWQKPRLMKFNLPDGSGTIEAVIR